LIKCVLIAAGGTGGHVFPGIAVARELQARGVHVEWLGTLHGLDTKLVPGANIPFSQIHIQGLRGKGKLGWLLAPFKIIRAVWQAIKVIKKTQADLVLGMGGYVSGPAGIAAWLLRKPLYIHEQNALAGMTNRYLAKIATGVLSGFPNVFPARCKPIVTGNPVRHDIIALPAPEQRFAARHLPLNLLILGGSQGAASINRLMPSVRQHFSAAQLSIWHQAGAKDLTATEEKYATAALSDAQRTELKVAAFIAEMPQAYAWADLVICRAGALTVGELAAAGVGSILVPFPYAVDDHQTHNANYLVQGNAAILIQERDLTADKLIAQLEKFLENRNQLLDMAVAARRLATPEATQTVVAVLLNDN